MLHDLEAGLVCLRAEGVVDSDRERNLEVVLLPLPLK